MKLSMAFQIASVKETNELSNTITPGFMKRFKAMIDSWKFSYPVLKSQLCAWFRFKPAHKFRGHSLQNTADHKSTGMAVSS